MRRSVTIVAMALVSVLAFVGLKQLADVGGEPKGFNPATIPDVVEYTAGIPKDTVLFTVDGQPVLAEYYLYWASYVSESMQQYMFSGGEMDWTTDMGDGVTLAQYVKEESLRTAQLYRVVETKANEQGCGLNQENIAAYEKTLAETIAGRGGETEFDKWLLQVNLSREGFANLSQTSLLFQNLQSEVMGAPATDAQVADYIATNDLLRAKHILIMTVDQATREPLSDEAQAAALTQAQDILTQLRSSEDPMVTFDTLMKEHSQDGGLATNPDGYLFTAGEMVPEFEQGTRDLEIGEISELVKSDFGYHIILRLDPSTPELATAIGNEQGQQKLDADMAQWMEEAQVETTQAYDQLDIPGFFNNLISLRAEIEAADAAEAAPSPSPSQQAGN